MLQRARSPNASMERTGALTTDLPSMPSRGLVPRLTRVVAEETAGGPEVTSVPLDYSSAMPTSQPQIQKHGTTPYDSAHFPLW